MIGVVKGASLIHLSMGSSTRIWPCRLIVIPIMKGKIQIHPSFTNKIDLEGKIFKRSSQMTGFYGKLKKTRKFYGFGGNHC